MIQVFSCQTSEPRNVANCLKFQIELPREVIAEIILILKASALERFDLMKDNCDYLWVQVNQIAKGSIAVATVRKTFSARVQQLHS